MQASDNIDATVASAKFIVNNLDCENNQPPPISGCNIAKSYNGQCLA